MNIASDIPDTLPLDIRTPWFNVLRSLQAHARQQSGVAILEIRILVKEDGIPITWTTPQVTKFEPKANADQIIEFLKGMM
jgi:hypothetical protein